LEIRTVLRDTIMGIVTVPTLSVRNTRIYVSPSRTNSGEQITLYKTEINTQFEGGYLILPVPYPQTIRIRHPTLPHPPNQFPFLEFLDRVERAFDYSDRDRRVSRPIHPRTVTTFGEIEILESIRDLRDYNDAEGILHPSVVNELAEIYAEPYWGFLLCELQRGSCVYEPICYTHRMISDNLFIPSLIYQPRSFHDLHIPEETELYDDRYFMNGCQYTETNPYRLTEVNEYHIRSIPWETLPHHYRGYLPYFLSEWRRGLHSNRDTMYQIHNSLQWDSDERYSPITPW
jgi:hypothetical protein